MGFIYMRTKLRVCQMVAPQHAGLSGEVGGMGRNELWRSILTEQITALCMDRSGCLMRRAASVSGNTQPFAKPLDGLQAGEASPE